MKDELTAWGRSIDLLGEAHELDASPLEILEQFDQMRERTSRPIQLPHHKRIRLPVDTPMLRSVLFAPLLIR